MGDSSEQLTLDGEINAYSHGKVREGDFSITRVWRSSISREEIHVISRGKGQMWSIDVFSILTSCCCCCVCGEGLIAACR